MVARNLGGHRTELENQNLSWPGRARGLGAQQHFPSAHTGPSVLGQSGSDAGKERTLGSILVPYSMYPFSQYGVPRQPRLLLPNPKLKKLTRGDTECFLIPSCLSLRLGYLPVQRWALPGLRGAAQWLRGAGRVAGRGDRGVVLLPPAAAQQTAEGAAKVRTAAVDERIEGRVGVA